MLIINKIIRPHGIHRITIPYTLIKKNFQTTRDFSAKGWSDEEIEKNTRNIYGKNESADFNSSYSNSSNKSDSKLTGKVVHLPNTPREPIRSEMYGLKIQYDQAPRDRLSPIGTIMGSESCRWSNALRDAQPQRFVNVDGKSYQLGVDPAPFDTRFWNASRNTKWWQGMVNNPLWFRTRRVGVANYDFVMKTDYCLFWIPAFILFSLAGKIIALNISVVPSFCLTYIQEELAYTTMTVKVIGRQWYWVYEVESPTDDEEEEEEDE